MEVPTQRTPDTAGPPAPMIVAVTRTTAGAGAGVGAILGWALAISLAAQLRVPIPGTEVPMTLQALAVLLAGFFTTPARAVAATLLYLTCGACGLPVFSPHSAGLAGPTAGYLVGFVAAAWLVAVLRGPRSAGYIRLVLAGGAGMAAVFAFGIVWRLPMLGGDLALAVRTGLLPFLAKAGVEVLLAASLVCGLRRVRNAGCDRVPAEGVGN